MGADIVTLIVGPEKHAFRVHRKLLCSKIEYFQKMFCGSYKEASENTAIFPEDDVQSFGLLLKWVYDGTIPPILYAKEGDSWRENWCALRLYVLANKFCVVEVEDRSVDACVTSLDEATLLPGVEDIRDGYAFTHKDSPWRRLMCRYFVHGLLFQSDLSKSWNNKAVGSTLSETPDLAVDVVPILRERNESTAEGGLQAIFDDWLACKFHIHKETEACPWKAKNGIRESSCSSWKE